MFIAGVCHDAERQPPEAVHRIDPDSGDAGIRFLQPIGPQGELVDIIDVGYNCAYLATPFAHGITDGAIYVDDGANVVA
jgi:hypothetical protein